MIYYIVKLLISAALIVAVSEVAKRSETWGGLIASLPLVSYLGIIWLYVDTRQSDPEHLAKIAELSWSILWLVLPSLAFFVALPLLLKKLAFAPSMAIATVVMFIAYGGMMVLLTKVGAPGVEAGG